MEYSRHSPAHARIDFCSKSTFFRTLQDSALQAYWTRRRALTLTQHAPPRAGLRLYLLYCANYRFLFFAKIVFQLSL
jgi:hypothetical protein